ncbi:MAG: MCE family protein [Alphaproteobacteria bacterium]|nr:MCE family protein [Alphaproteobacteria bacterium]
METRAGYLMVGIFVLFSFFGILGFFFWIAKSDLDYKGNFYSIYFKGSVTGLTLGGAVNYLGVPVGTVKKIELDSECPDCVHLVVAIKESIAIKEDAYASLELQGLTGYKTVQIYGGSKESSLLKAKKGQLYPIIASRYSGVEEIMTTLPRMINKLTNLFDRFNATFNEQNRARFSDTLKNVELLSERLAETSLPLKELVENTNTAVKDFNQEVKAFSLSSQGTLSEFKSVANDMGNFLKDNKAALDTITQSGSYDLIQTLKDTREMVTSATRFFDKVDENPRSLLFKTQRKGVSVSE